MGLGINTVRNVGLGINTIQSNAELGINILQRNIELVIHEGHGVNSIFFKQDLVQILNKETEGLG
jgi:hypothetical protein